MTPRRRMQAVATGAGTRAGRRLIAIGAAVALPVVFAALTNQYAKTYTLARDETRLEQRRRDLIADNARLHDEIEHLQSDDRYIEQIARQQLGLVRPGEVELLVVPYDGTVSAPGATRRGGAATPTGGDGGSVLDPGRPAAIVDGRPQGGIGEPGGGGPAAADVGAEPPARPRRGIGVWAIGVRDAVLRLLRTVHR